MKFHHHIQRPGLQRFPQMRHQFHVAIPGKKRPVFPPHGHAVNAGIGGGNRLHRHMPAIGAASASAAPSSALLNGSTPLPSLEVPSGNSTSVSPASSRSRIASRASPVCAAPRPRRQRRCAAAAPGCRRTASSPLPTWRQRTAASPPRKSRCRASRCDWPAAARPAPGTGVPIDADADAEQPRDKAVIGDAESCGA